MIGFLKGVLKGLMYVLFFPLGIISICLYGAFGVFVFLFQSIKLIYLFFTGRNFKNELIEDIEARKILEGENQAKEESEPALSLYPSDSEMYDTQYVSPSFEDKKEEESEELTEGEENDQ